MQGLAGRGTFGTVLDVLDTKHNERIALKVVRSVKVRRAAPDQFRCSSLSADFFCHFFFHHDQRYLDAAKVEIDILDKIREADKDRNS